MHISRLHKAGVLTLGIALLSSPLFAGAVFKVETTYSSGDKSQSSEMSVNNGNLKMEISSDQRDSGDAIYRGDRRQMVMVDHDNKTYMVIDKEAIENIGGQVQGQLAGAMKEMEKQLEKLDPKQREMVEKMMKGRMPAVTGEGSAAPRQVTEYRKTSQRETHQGYPCVKYEVVRGDEKVREIWVTDWNNVEGSDEVLDAFKDMASFYEELMDSIGKMTGGFGAGVFGGENPMESFAKIDGFPVVTRNFEGGELESEAVLESVVQRDLDPDAFEPPKGYRLRTMGPQ